MATYYISPTGNDTTGNGSSGNPWLTVNKAFTASASGDTIVCKNGTYSDWMPNGFTARTIQAETNGSVIFNAGGTDYSGRTIGSALTTTRIVGIKFYNTSTSPGAFPLFLIGTSTTGVVYFESCIFDTITVYGDEGNGWGGLAGGAVAGTNFVVSFAGCLFYNLDYVNYAALFATKLGYSGTITVTNCTIVFRAGDTMFRIVSAKSSTGGVTIKNCIFYNSTGTTMTFLSGTYYTYNNNVAYGFSSLPSGSNNLTSDPLFIDAANSNFRLRPTSPCLNAGVAV